METEDAFHVVLRAACLHHSLQMHALMDSWGAAR